MWDVSLRAAKMPWLTSNLTRLPGIEIGLALNPKPASDTGMYMVVYAHQPSNELGQLSLAFGCAWQRLAKATSTIPGMWPLGVPDGDFVRSPHSIEVRPVTQART